MRWHRRQWISWVDDFFGDFFGGPSGKIQKVGLKKIKTFSNKSPSGNLVISLMMVTLWYFFYI